MVALSPIKTCDILRETGGVELEQLAQRLAVAPDDLQREIATLRHMEKLKAVKEGDKKRFCLW